MTISVWQDDPPPVEVDVLIIGAGISGLGTAFWLRQLAPQLSVAILDRGGPASGASGRNAGFMTSGSIAHFARQVERHGEDTALALWELTRENHRLLEQHLLEDGGCDYLQRGALSISRRAERFHELAAAADRLRAAGVPVADVDPAASPASANYGNGGPVRAWNVVEDARVDPVALMRRLADACGATIYPGRRVQALDLDGDEVMAETDLGTYVAPRAVLAMNAWTADLVPDMRTHLSAVRAQCLQLEPIPHRIEQQVYATDDWVYLRQHEDGSLLAGGHRLVDEAGEVGTEDRINEKVTAAIETTLRTRFADLIGGEVRVRRYWSGALAYATRGIPLVGAVPHHEHLFLTAGYSGHGMGLGFACAKRLAETLVHERHDPLLRF